MTRITEHSADKSDPHRQTTDTEDDVERLKVVGSDGMHNDSVGNGEPEHTTECVGTGEVCVFGESRDDETGEEGNQSDEEDERVIPGIVDDQEEINPHGSHW